MIVDTSVIIALFKREPEAAAFAGLIDATPIARISAGTYVELAVVIDRSLDAVSSGALDPFLERSGIRVEPLTASQARIARAAHQRFGRGSGHPARLNMGDCFSYALARDLGEPLLFKGNDFALTDIELAIEPLRHKRLSEIVAGYGISSP